MTTNQKVPDHIAIILDGNGRWAKKRRLPRALGHKAGCETLKRILDSCNDIGLKYLTVYAFSTENWKRSQEEVSALMQLIRYYIPRLEKKAMQKNTRVLIMGNRERFTEDVIRILDSVEETTKNNTGLTFVLGLNYGGRDEIRRAAVALAQEVAAGRLKPEEITEEMISARLDNPQVPDPDLIIRTSGEMRLSNFLTWQSAYAEFEFPEVLWPDFSDEDLEEALALYNSRDRRFGGRKPDGS
ncbi:MAG: isoprenyl transferase [Lachnospiraceae bacterium]|nr:isoprenyl transferase [Lachnospiraceae bacterium]